MALVATTIATVALVMGWVVEVDGFRRVSETWPATVPETASAMMAAGTALLILDRSSSPISVSSALALVSLGFVALGTYLTWQAGVDVTEGMAPSTSFTLGAISCGILLRGNRAMTAQILAIVLSAMTALITGFALLGYLFDAEALTSLTSFKQMGLSTALGVFFLSLSLMFTNRDNVVLRGLLGTRIESRIIKAYAVTTSILVLACCKYMMTLVSAGWLSPSVRMTILVTLLLTTIIGGALAMGYFVERLEQKKLRLRAVEKVLADTDHAKQLANTRSENLQVLGQVVAGVAHDFNNAMTALRGNLELLEMDPANGADYATEALAAANRASEMAQQLVKSGKKNSDKPRPHSLVPIIEQVLSMFRRVLPANIGLEFEAPTERIRDVDIDPSSFERALLNLLINAQHAIEKGGESGKINVRVAARKISEKTLASGMWGATTAPGMYTQVEVWDNGCGMNAETLASAGKPYFTTKGENAGSGLGLASAIGMCEQVGGALTVKSKLGIGTQIAMVFPAASLKGWTSADDLNAQDEDRILLVCHDNTAAENLIYQLETAGNVVEWQRDPMVALDGPISGTAPHAVLIEPDGMQGISGRELAALFRNRWPNLDVTLVGESREDRQLARLQKVANTAAQSQLACGRGLGNH